MSQPAWDGSNTKFFFTVNYARTSKIAMNEKVMDKFKEFFSMAEATSM